MPPADPPPAPSSDPKGCSAPRGRAAALPPDERRAEIIAVTVPLLGTHGTAITIRQIAAAAGLAEGTLFRVFPDKDAIIQAAVDTVLDPAPLQAALRAIDRDLPLEERLTAGVAVLQERVARIWQLMAVVGMNRVPPSDRPPDLSALAELFEPDRDRIDRDPQQAAQLLRGLTFASTHPALIADGPLDPADIVSILLDGIRADAGEGPC